MDLQGYWRVIRKSWWIILLVTLFGVGGGALVNLRTTPTYESNLTFYVSTPNDAAGTNAYSANQYAMAKIESYIQLLSSDSMAKRIIATTDTDLSIAQVSQRLSATSDVNTVIINAKVTDSDPERSLEIARAIGSEFGPMVEEFDNRTQDGVTSATVELAVINDPTLNPSPVAPRVRTNLALGLLAGLALGCGFVVVRGLMDKTVQSIDALRTATELPVLGAVGLDSDAKKSPVLTGDQVRSVRAENYRQIRTNLQFMDLDKPIHVLVVTSSVAGEGKSSTAVNLAIVSAETGRRVLLIEADLRRPRAADYLGLEGAVGLSNVLAGQVAVREVLQPWGSDGLMVLPSGSVPPNPSEMLGSSNMVNLLADLRTMFDLIIIDTPPLLPVTDGAVAATQADGVVVVVRYGKTTRNQVHSSLYSLEAVDARVLGCVLSMVPRKGAAASGYDGYGYYEDDPDKRAAPLEPSAVQSPGRGSTKADEPNHEPTMDGSAPHAAGARPSRA